MNAINTHDIQRALLAADKAGDRAEAGRLRQCLQDISNATVDRRSSPERAADEFKMNSRAALSAAREHLANVEHTVFGSNRPLALRNAQQRLAEAERQAGVQANG